MSVAGPQESLLGYQIMKRKFKRWWSTIQPISSKRTITSDLHSLNTKKTTTYDVEIPGPCLGQAQKCGGVKRIVI